jgi:cytochrome c biogenesis protein CcmG, thiol:disulfide interchange protein DsbE
VRILRFAVVPALVVPVAWLLFQGLGRDPRVLPSPLIGRAAPTFELVAIDGQTFDSATLRDQTVLVNFWASWCFECIEEHRVLLEAQQRYGDDLVIIGVLYQDSVDDALAFLARYGDGGWPNLVDADGALAIDYGVSGVPESFFIDAAGIVRYKQWGPVTRAVLDAQLPALLSGSRFPSN